MSRSARKNGFVFFCRMLAFQFYRKIRIDPTFFYNLLYKSSSLRPVWMDQMATEVWTLLLFLLLVFCGSWNMVVLIIKTFFFCSMGYPYICTSVSQWVYDIYKSSNNFCSPNSFIYNFDLYLFWVNYIFTIHEAAKLYEGKRTTFVSACFSSTYLCQSVFVLRSCARWLDVKSYSRHNFSQSVTKAKQMWFAHTYFPALSPVCSFTSQCSIAL